MKCRKDDVAEELLEEYTENVDDSIRYNPLITTTRITGYSKLGKVEKALAIYIHEFNVKVDVDDKTTKFLDTSTLNALLEGCVKKSYVDDAEKVYNIHLKAEGVVDVSTVSIMIKGYCKSKHMVSIIKVYMI